MLNITKTQLINLQLNVGHSKGKWLKFFDNVIYGIRHNLIIFNLDFTIYNLRKSLNFIINVTNLRGKLLFISSFINKKKIGMSQYILKSLSEHGYYDGKYIGGLVSNIKSFFSIKNLSNKKAIYNFSNLNKIYPSCVIISDSNRFYLTIKEASYLAVPSISIIDTDLDYYFSFYSLYGNNESKLIHFFLLYINYLGSRIGSFLESKLFFINKVKKLLFFFQLRLLYYFFNYFFNIFFFCFVSFEFFQVVFFFFSKLFLQFYKIKRYAENTKFFIKFLSFFVYFFFSLLFFYFFKYNFEKFSFRTFSKMKEKKRYYIYNLVKFRKNYLKLFYIKRLYKFNDRLLIYIRNFISFFNNFFFFENKNLNFYLFKFFYIYCNNFKHLKNKSTYKYFLYFFLTKLNYIKLYNLKVLKINLKTKFDFDCYLKKKYYKKKKFNKNKLIRSLNSLRKLNKNSFEKEKKDLGFFFLSFYYNNIYYNKKIDLNKFNDELLKIRRFTQRIRRKINLKRLLYKKKILKKIKEEKNKKLQEEFSSSRYINRGWSYEKKKAYREYKQRIFNLKKDFKQNKEKYNKLKYEMNRKRERTFFTQ